MTERDIISFAFDQYCDMLIEALVQAGLDENTALDCIFSAATVWAERGRLPKFPEGEVSNIDVGKWLVRAKDERFFEFVLESVVR